MPDMLHVGNMAKTNGFDDIRAPEGPWYRLVSHKEKSLVGDRGDLVLVLVEVRRVIRNKLGDDGFVVC